MTASSPSQPPEPEASAEARFAFGKNWQRFLQRLDERRLERAEASLREFWPVSQNKGETEQRISFLDIGSGSGTFSLIARRLGARVHSFDYDTDSVACTTALRRQFFPWDPDWVVEQGSALDQAYLESLGKFQIVYSWGVLHHTGAMWQALENACLPVAEQGLLVIAIYNDQGWKSRFWMVVKRIYCSGWLGRWLITGLFVPAFLAGFFAGDVLKGRSPFARYRPRHDPRGMSVVTDIIDWIGGYPFEVATPEQLVTFYESRGFRLVQQKLTSGLGCNEFVFQKMAAETQR